MVGRVSLSAPQSLSESARGSYRISRWNALRQRPPARGHGGTLTQAQREGATQPCLAMNLDSTVAVVTGASRGIGRATALALASGGCHVFGLARSEDALETLADVLGDRFTPLVADVTDAKAVKTAIDHAAKEGGRLDILVNNAGLGRFDPVDEQTLDDWDLQIDTNLSGVFYCTRAAVPHMKAQAAARGENAEAGHIVHVASIAGLIGNPNLSAYNATKHGLRGFSDATMKELRPFGIRTTCVYPGSVDTTFGDKAGMGENPHAMSPESIADTICHVITSPYKTLISEVVMRPMGARK